MLMVVLDVFISSASSSCDIFLRSLAILILRHYKCTADICGDFAVDINGINTKPNTYGKDIFYFDITKNGIKPQGREERRPFDDYCNMTITSTSYNGYGCAAWVLQFKNMDYLKCNDLTWDGKHSCD